MDPMDLIFRTADKRGLCAANHVLYENAPFFDGTLETDNIRDVYVETKAYHLKHARHEELRDFTHTARRFSYAPFAYGGNPSWSKPTGVWQIADFIQAVLHFNDCHRDSAFQGACLDVQPFEVVGLRGNTAMFRSYLETYIEMLEKVFFDIHIYNETNLTDFRLKIVLPRQLLLLDLGGYLARLQDACHEVIRVDYVD